MSKRDLARAIARVYLKRAAEEAAYTVSREWDDKQRAWRSRMEDNITRWIDNYNNNVGKIDKIDDHLDRLTGRLSTTRGAKQLAKIKEWVEQEETRRTLLVKRNADLAKKIREVEQKLSSGGETPWFYRESDYGRGGHGSFRTNRSLHRTKREQSSRHTTTVIAKVDVEEVKPTRPKTFLELLLGL